MTPRRPSPRLRQGRTTPWTEAEFWAMGKRVGPCLEWQRVRDKRGYGRVTWQHKDDRAHRVAFALVNGPIPDEMQVCHHCDNPPCFDPAHLFLGTIADNAHDAQAKGRQSTGIRHPNARLNEAMVRDIRALVASGASHRQLARRFGVSQQTITKVSLHRSWKHVM